jgi:CheY-like chemotaxis protein
MMRETIRVHPEVERKRSTTLGRTRPYQVLLVEDDKEMREMVAQILRRNGFHVIEACDGVEALDHLGEAILDEEFDRTLDLLLTDQRMPGFQGLELIDFARCAGIEVPAILVTAFADDATHARARALGGTSVLDKPFEMSDLVMLARTVVAKAGRP